MKIKCNCNTQAPILNESKAPRKLLSSNLQYYIDNDIPLTESNNGMNSTQYLEVIKEARSLYSRNLLELDGTDLLLIRESNLGNYAKYKGREVPLDFPIKLKEGLYKIYRRNSSKEIKKEIMQESKPGLWDNIRAKRKRVGKKGMAKKGSKAYKLAKKEGDKINKETNENIDEVVRTQDLHEFMEFLKETCKPENIEEAKYQGRTVTLNKPMRGDSKKFKVYVNSGKKNADGTIKVKKVEFGAKGMNIKKNNPKRRKAFRARHNCANPGPKTKARYWSCRKW